MQQPVNGAMETLPTYSTQLTNDALLYELKQQYPEYAQNGLLLINISQQRLYQIKIQSLIKTHIISSASNGTGNIENSGKTPLGAHFIREKFGDGALIGSQFKARQLTGHIPKILTNPGEQSDGDNITSRILWLSGLERGYNQGEGVDSYNRYIYIHGTDEEGRLGTLASHGCIRMSNQAIIDLYAMVDRSTLVYIYKQ